MAIGISVFNAVVGAVHNAFGFPFGGIPFDPKRESTLIFDFKNQTYQITEGE